MQEPAVEVEHLSKVYRVYRSPWDRLLEALLRRPRHRAFSALHDVSFSLERGQGLAILGENGAGKSTLLKILAGIGTPTAGRLQVRGKIASILELGSGFHPEFTGRQNIVLNAAMLGLGERELQQKLPTIVEWSELGDFIDQPVKVYSTGMAMRLGFSIATQVEPDVLIIDEALSVGDGYFQKKCMDRLLQFVGAGGTLLFCSHAMYYASAFCQRALWLRNGRVEALGAVTDVVREYENFLLHKSARGAGNDPANPADAGDPAAAGRLAVVTAGSRAATAGAPIGTVAAGSPPPAQGAADKKADDADLDAVRRPARIAEVRILGGGSPPAGDAEVLEPGGRVQPRCYLPGDPWELEIDWEAASPQFAFHVGVGINRSDDLEVLTLATHLDGRPPLSGATRYALRVALPHLPLVKGDFTLYVFLLDESGLHIYDQRIYRRAFSVQPPRYAFGLIVAEHSWSQQAQAGSQATAAGEVAGACRR